MSELDRTTSWRLWAIAAFCAVSLHVGGIAAAVYEMRKEAEEDGLGANAIEVGMEMMSPDVEQTDLPQGPNSQASAASPAVQEQKAVEKETDLPQDKANESAEPDLVVTENKANKPEEETPEKAQKQQQASQESVASEDSAEQKLDDPKISEKSQAPEIGISTDKKRLAAEWSRQLSAYLEKHKRYPVVQKSKNVTVKISFTLDRMGKVLAASVVEGSGDSAFDEAAVGILHRAKNLPPPPPAMADESLSYVVDIRFADKKK